MKSEIKNDKYKKARGGVTKKIELSCAYCGNFLLTYQKDGSGSLKRLYLDRIITPDQYKQYINLEIKNIPNLVCGNCNERIGSPYIYEKENRKAYILNQGSFCKKIVK